jgi:hypothetical protein
VIVEESTFHREDPDFKGRYRRHLRHIHSVPWTLLAAGSQKDCYEDSLGKVQQQKEEF